MEKDCKANLQSKINTGLESVKTEKAVYDKTEQNVIELSQQIKLYMDKFDQLKSDITESGKKFELNQQDIEQKRMEIQLLETEIKNIELTTAKRMKVAADVAEEKKRLTA